MYQVNFSEQSIAALKRLQKWDQMPIIEKLSGLTAKDFETPGDDLGRFTRDGKSYYRLRAGDYRLYFELKEGTLFCHYLLHQHSLSDFVFRFKLPIADDKAIEQHKSFWQYLESLKR